MKKIMRLTLLCFAAVTLSAQLAFTQTDPDNMVKKFFTELSKDGSEKALDNLYATSAWITKAGASIQTLKIKMEEQLSKDAMAKWKSR